MSGPRRPDVHGSSCPSDRGPGDLPAAGPTRRRALGTLAAPAGLLLAPAALWAATPGVDAPPLAQPPREVSLPAFHEARLRNGVGVVVAPRHQTPLVSAVLMVRAGQESDAHGQSGVAAMTAALLAKGAVRRGRREGSDAIARQAEALGSSLDAGAGWRSTTLSLTVSTPRLEAAVSLMADCLRQPLLTSDELERVRAQALDAMRLTLGNPGDVARLAMRRMFWGDTPFGAVTPPPALRRITRAQVLAFHARQLRPERTVLVLAGDIDASRAVQLAERLLGDWRVAAAEPPLPALLPPATMAAPLLLIDMPGSGQSGVVVAAPFASAGDADRRIGLVASAVLGGGYSARLNQEVRIKRGLSYGATCEAELLPTGGMLSARAQTGHAGAVEVLQLMRGEIRRLADEPPSGEELAARQATLVGGFARRLDTTGGLAAMLLGQLSQGRPIAELDRYVSDVLAVTPEQVRDFARSHWQGERLRSVIAGDMKAIGDALGAVAADALRVPLAELDLERLGRGAGR